MALRDNIARDLGWKLVSLALAVAIWLTINRVSQGPARPATSMPAMGMRTFTNLPVLLMAAATDGREVSIAPDTVTITLSGPPAKLSAMTGEEIRVILDLMGIEAARGLRKRVDVSVPPGMAFLSAEPPQVNVTVVPKRE